VPLPDIAVEGGLRIDLVLMHVDLFLEDLHDRLDQARMRAPVQEEQDRQQETCEPRNALRQLHRGVRVG